MKTVKKMMMIVFIAIIALSQNGCKKDCDDAVIKKQCLKQLRVLEDHLDNVWSGNGPSCKDVYKELEKLKNDCGKKDIFDENDFDNIQADIDNHCAG